MKYSEARNNIWSFYNSGLWIVIPINGFVKKSGELVMGAGLARQAKDGIPHNGCLDAELGAVIKVNGNRVRLCPELRMIVFPTKYHWTEFADIALIKFGLGELETMADAMAFGPRTVAVPKLGCGNGKLDWDTEIKPLFDTYLDERFLVVTRPERTLTV